MIDENYLLPCDVLLGPATVIHKGCKLSTLLAALRCREERDSRFDRGFCVHGVGLAYRCVDCENDASARGASSSGGFSHDPALSDMTKNRKSKT